MYPPLTKNFRDVVVRGRVQQCSYSIEPVNVPDRYAQRSIVILTYMYNPSIKDCLENNSDNSDATPTVIFPENGEGVVALVASLGYPEVIFLSLKTSVYGPSLNEAYPPRLATLSPSFYPDLWVPKSSLTYEKEIYWGSVDIVTYNGDRYVFKYAWAYMFTPHEAENRQSISSYQELATLLIPRSPLILSPSHVVFSNSPEGDTLFEGFLTLFCPLGTLADYIETQPPWELEKNSMLDRRSASGPSTP